jgi:hypothetical protein
MRAETMGCYQNPKRPGFSNVWRDTD